MSLSSSAIETSANPTQTLAAIGWMVASGLMFVFVTGIVRYLGSTVPVLEAAFLRYLFGLVLISPALLRLTRNVPNARLTGIFAIRGFVHGFAVMLWFYAMAHIPVAQVTAIGYASPIFVTIGAALFLGERMHVRRMAGIAVGFLGVLIILRPGFEEVSLGQLAQLTAAPLFATSYIIAKKLTHDQDTTVIVAMLSLFCTLTLAPGAYYQWQTPHLSEAGLLALTAIFATVGHYTLTRAFHAAPITVTQPVTFLQLVWAVSMGIILFDEPADPPVLLGGAIIVAAATYISHREAQAARKTITPPAGATKI